MRVRAVAALVSAAASVVMLAGCSGEPAPPATPTFAGACGYIGTGDAAREVDLPPSTPEVTGTVDAAIDTSAGTIGLTLDADAAPCTVGSLVSLAGQGYFDDTQCHRLTTSGIFVLQCGDPSGTGRGGPGYSFADEVDGSETYPAGTVAMANPGRPDSNGSQFFLVYEDSRLPPSYTVFGQLSDEGLEVVRTIAAAGVEGGGGDGAPAEDVTIRAVTVD